MKDSPMSNTPSSSETIFARAIAINSPQEREAYVREACGGDLALRGQIEKLVADHLRAGDFLEGPAVGEQVTLDAGPLTEKPGTVIGRYKLLEQIGEGGMGVVYMAEQTQPVRRRVALKIIKIGMDTKQVIARFEAERQALALMDHPNIARILDAGATETGRPYFVMDLVKGVPLTEYCDKNKLPARERLELFLQVCGAVQHAHQKGIIHRDIKPTNVMVTLHDGKPVPKVIDFGISKATNQRLTEKTLFTGYARMIGTPAYMSPEQAEMSGLDVDTRSDIYSLGALLYELLTGMTPFNQERLRSAGYGEVQRILREEDPPRPSVCLSTHKKTLPVVALRRGTDPTRLNRTVRGELDWIVMKTLEKDRTRRYETAAALADDIERHLHNEPVLAGRPGSVYRLRKFARRHRVGVAAGLAVTIALIAGLALAGLGFREARREARNAKEAAERESLARQEQIVARQQAEDRLRLANRNVRLAWDALEEFYGRVADRWNVRKAERRREKDPHGLYRMVDEPRGADEGDQGLWRRLLRFYESFARTNRQAPELRASVGEAYERVRAARRKLAEYFPNTIEHRRALGRASSGLAALRHAAGRNKEAEEGYRNAVETQEELVKTFPTVREYQTDLAASHRGWAVVLKDMGRHQAAEQHRRAAGELDGEHGATPKAATEWQIAYPDFSDYSGLNLVGDAGVREKRLRLTSADRWKTGAAWLKTKQRVTLGFETTFRFQMSGDRGGCPGGADGIAFVVQNDTASAQGGGGEGLGYGGIARSLAVEFDPYGRNVGEHTYGQHISVQTDGTAPNRSSPAFSLGIVTAPFKLDDNRVHIARIRYVPGTLSIFLDGRAEGALIVPVELATTLGLDDGRAWVGLTAATGTWYQRHDILSWQFRPLVDPAAALPNPRAAPPQPPDADDEGDRDPRSLQDALRFYKRFYEASGEQDEQEVADPGGRFVIAKAYWRIGDFRWWLQEHDDAMGAYNTAYKRLRSLVEEYPEVPEYREELFVKSRELANVHADRGEHEKAVDALSHAIQFAPDDASTADLRERRGFLWNHRGYVRQMLGQWRKAVEDFSKAIELDPKSAVLWNNRGSAYGNLGQWDKALDDLAEAVQLSPRDHHCWSCRAWAYANLRQWDKAIADYSKAIELDPENASYRNRRGFPYYELGQHDKALADYSKAIELDPENAFYWNFRGFAYAGMRQYGKALADYAKAIELDPTPAVYWDNRGLAYLRLGQCEKAIADSSKAIELDPKNALYWNNRGVVYGELGQYEEAIADCSKAIELDPKNALHWSYRGFAYSKLGQHDKALADHSKAIELDPKDALSWRNLGTAQYRAGSFAEAVEALAKSIELQRGEGSPGQWLFLAMAHWKLGNKDEATRRFRRSVEWIRKNAPGNLELAGRRDEAAEVLGLRDELARQEAARTGQVLRKCTTLWGHAAAVRSVGSSPDGKMLATGSFDKTAKLWDLAKGEPRATLEGHSGIVNGVAFTPDGKMLATVSWDKTVRLWDVASGEELAALQGHADRIPCVAISPDGGRIASGSYDCTARIWDVAGQAEVTTLKGHGKQVECVAFSPDGKTLATGSWDETAKLWDTATWKEQATLEIGHDVRSVAFSPDGRLLAVSSSAPAISVWDAAGRKRLDVLTAHGAGVWSLAFSHDGRLLASASRDKTVKLWDVASGKVLATLIGHRGNVWTVAFSPDGKTIASGSADTIVRLWDVSAIGKKETTKTP